MFIHLLHTFIMSLRSKVANLNLLSKNLDCRVVRAEYYSVTLDFIIATFPHRNIPGHTAAKRSQNRL